MDKTISRSDDQLVVKENTEGKEEGTGSNIQKWLITAVLVLTWFCMGSSLEMAGPTLKDFVRRLQSNYDSVAQAISLRNIGEFIGGVVGGVLVDRLGRFCYLTIGLSLATMAITTALLPIVTDLHLLGFLYFVLGLLLGIIIIAGTKANLCLWEDKAASPLHVLYFGYAVGGLMSSLIANPFLNLHSGDNESNNTSVVESDEKLSNATGMMSTNSTSMISTNSTSASGSNSSIYKAYLIVSIYTCCIAIMFCIFHFYKSKQTIGWQSQGLPEEIKLRDMFNPASCADGNFCFGTTLFGLLFLYYGAAVGIERIMGTFIRSYSIDHFRFSRDEGSYINMVFWICFAVGRFSGFIFARFVSIKTLLVMETTLLLTAHILMAVFASGNAVALWVLSVFSGLAMGPMYPSGIGWSHGQLKLTGMAITFASVGAGLGGFLLTITEGHVYQKYGPVAFIYSTLCVSILISVIVALLTGVSFLKKNLIRSEYTQFGKNENPENKISE